MTITQMATKLRLTNKGVIERLIKHKLHKRQVSNYTYDDFLVIYYEKYTNLQFRKKGVIKANDLKIIDYYFNNKDNKTTDIAKQLNIPLHRVNYVINNYLQLKYAIVESKMNYE